MLVENCRVARRGCQAAVVAALAALFLAAGARAAETDAFRTRQAVKMLKRLERTCLDYSGPNEHKLLNAAVLEAVRLYEEAKYDPALDSILLARAMYPKDIPCTHYGLQPGLVEIALRWPGEKEKTLLGLDAGQHTWVMVAVANLSGVKLDLAALRAGVSCEGKAVEDAGGKKVESIPAEDAGLRRQLGAKAGELRPPSVNQGETATFPMVFPVFGRWTEIRFIEETNKIDAPVRNYAEMAKNVTRLLRARKVASDRRTAHAGAGATEPKPGDSPPPPPRRDRYVLVGYIRNEISAGKYGVKLVAAALAQKHRQFYVRLGGRTVAELKSTSPRRTIAELVRSQSKLKTGDGVYVLDAKSDK